MNLCMHVMTFTSIIMSSRSLPLQLHLDNSNELGAADFHLAEVRSLQLDAFVRGDRRTRGATVRKLQGVGNSTFVLSVTESSTDCGTRQ
jgi:hypothetical protein